VHPAAFATPQPRTPTGTQPRRWDCRGPDHNDGMAQRQHHPPHRLL